MVMNIHMQERRGKGFLRVLMQAESIQDYLFQLICMDLEQS